MTKINLIVLMISLFATSVFAQGVGINTTGSTPDASAGLDVNFTNKGILIPRVALTGTTDATTIASPATSLMVYNTATVSDVSPGFYYWNGTVWIRVMTATHYVGELYGGGVVFWVDHTGQHGLIVSMIDLSTSQAWSNVASSLIGATAQSDWDGNSNTTAITGQSGHANSTARLCANYTNADYGTGTYSDWYLPSRGELNHLWNNLYEVQKALSSDGNASTIPITKTYYWSSSEYSSSYSYQFNFVEDSANYYPKSGTDYVRAVRAF